MNLKAKSTGARSAEITFHADVGDYENGIGSGEFVALLDSLGTLDHLTVGINSQGGDVFAGLAIHNALARCPAHVTTRVDGLAASAASVILMGGDTIEACENGIVMLHRAWTLAMGNCEDLRASAQILEKCDGQLIGTYAARTGNSRSKIEQWMRAETWMSADEAKRFGFVDEIVKTASFKAKLDADRFKNTPQWVSARLSGETTPRSYRSARAARAIAEAYRHLAIAS